ncbi:7-carboxy-7-deazaguanine synthase QueE [Hydrogenimonas sp.]
MLYLVEHFFSIQGEGRYSGSPSIFLRFGGCNLRCPGFGETDTKEGPIAGCDTVRAVHTPIFKKNWLVVRSADTIDSIVASYTKNLDYMPDIVLTGGEPMIYSQNLVFNESVRRMIGAGYRVTMETNATIAPDFKRYPFYADVVFAMAVKLSNSGEPHEKRVNAEAIRAIATEGKNPFFKFTLDRTIIENGAREQIEAIIAGFKNEVFCMPLGESIEKLRIHAPAVVDFCLKYGYRYTDRLHVRIYNREEKR